MKFERRLIKRRKPISKWQRFGRDIAAFFTLTWAHLFVLVPLLYLTYSELNFREDLQLVKEASFADASLFALVGEESPDEIFEYLEYPGASLDFSHPKYSRKPSNKISKKDILQDKENRISPEFHIPVEIHNRVVFWYDIYTKYSNTHYVFHHKDYPWIIFGVADTTEIMNEESKNKWTKYHKSEKLVKETRSKIRNKLFALAKKNLKKLSDEDLKLFEMLNEIPGKNRKKVILDAAYNMRTQIGQKEFIEKGITESAQYLPHMENVFREEEKASQKAHNIFLIWKTYSARKACLLN